MRRGQTAFEFLASYGTMILILITMFATLVYFGIIDFEDFSPNSCTIEPEFLCDEYKVFSNGSIAFGVRNNFANMNTVTFNISTEYCTLSDDTYTETGLRRKEFMGENDLVYFTCDSPLLPGESFVADMSFTFVRQDRAIPHTVYGKLVTEVED